MKRAASSKRAALPLASDHTREFERDWDRHNRAGRLDMVRLRDAMLLVIANERPLPAEWLDHPLTGRWEGYQELHIGGDFLLIYKLTRREVVFTRAGTHAELFE